MELSKENKKAIQELLYYQVSISNVVQECINEILRSKDINYGHVIDKMNYVLEETLGRNVK